MAFLEPLDKDLHPELAEDFAIFEKILGFVPSDADQPLMHRMKQHWSDDQIVEILGAICLYGFLNRWNDSMATELEQVPTEMGEKVLKQGGWDGKRHK